MGPLTIGALGVVYGDIGTSPLYAFRESIRHTVAQGEAVLQQDVLGVLSLILWALMIVVTLKYVIILLRIDNRGEGGTLALMALARSVIYRNTTGFLILGMLGAALFYGDAVITPAISVLSALEGLQVVTPALGPFVLPITIGIILALFFAQSKGTGKMSGFFGPIMVTWFGLLGTMGVVHLLKAPQVLMAFNPFYAVQFLTQHGSIALLTLGAVFLAVTGTEALYADLGHFGRKPIQLAWAWVVFPCLSLNYMGQAAMVLTDPSTADNPFFKMVPDAGLAFLVVMATVATIIASQAVITGAFSLTRQAVNLGLFPRMVIKHTSAEHSGQIYMPQVNYFMMVAVIILVLAFRSSSSLAAMYGISVALAMVVDAVMVFFVIWQLWEWKLASTMLLVTPFLMLDLSFLSANLVKLLQGGWVPIVIASTLFLLMATWIQGTFIINSRARKRDIKFDRFLKEYKTKYPDLQRVKGSAFFLASDPNLTPAALVQNIRHNRVLHEKNIILAVKIEPIPHVLPEDRIVITPVNSDFVILVMRFGFKDDIYVQEELMKINQSEDNDIKFDWEYTSLFLSRRALRSHPKYGMPLWQDWIYIQLNKHASEPTDYYGLPVSRVIEIGRQFII